LAQTITSAVVLITGLLLCKWLLLVMHAQFMAWDTFSRRRIDLVGRQDDGDRVIAHEFDFSIPNQLIYSRNGVNITSTPVSHYRTEGPVALRLDWNGLSVTYSGVPHFSPMPFASKH